MLLYNFFYYINNDTLYNIMKKIISLLKIALLFLTTLTFIACGRICIGKMLSIAKKSMVFRKFACLYATSHKLALLFLTLILVACGGGSSTPAPNTAGGGNAGGGGNPDETPSTKIRISEATGDEGGMITFKVIANPTNAKPITFKFEATIDNTTTAIGADLSGELIGNGTIATNDSSTTISIAIANDNLREHNETFMVILSDLSPNEVTFGDNVAIGTILANDDATGIVTISLVANAEATEDSGTINFKVKSEFTAISPFTFGYEVDLDNSSADTDDFDGATNGTATIDASSTMISIKIATDDTIEQDEIFRLLLTNTSENATIDSADNSATGRILNDDLGEISNATAIIGDTAITLNWTNPNPVSNIFAGAVIAYQESSTAPANCSDGMTQLVNNALATSDTITGLTNGTAYSFRICARSNAGSLSGGKTLTNLIPKKADKDGDGLIELTNATELYNIRHNLAGTSYKTAAEAYPAIGGCPSGVCRGYELTTDINLSSFANWNPIGSSSSRFTAILEGNNNKISNLTIDRTSDSYIGLFASIEDATISNLKLTDVSINGGSHTGALVGDAINITLSSIELIGDASQETSNAELTGRIENVGGLAGRFSGTISDSTSSLTVIGKPVGELNGDRISNVGGLVGLLQSGEIKNSNSSGAVLAITLGFSQSFSYGGLVGRNNGARIIKSWASGNISNNNNSSVSQYHGGLVGRNNWGSISQSWASGNIFSDGQADQFVGGLVGELSGGSIKNSWATSEITAFGTRIGGLVGNLTENGSISQSWASGNVSSSASRIGGLVGNHDGGSISQSWASGNVLRGSLLGGLVGQQELTRGHYINNINQTWASGNIPGGTYSGGLIGVFGGRDLNGRNYQLNPNSGRIPPSVVTGGGVLDLANDGVGVSFVLGGLSSPGRDATSLRALAALSGAASEGTSDWGTRADWHAGFDRSNPSNTATADFDLDTRFCDTDGDGTIDTNEQKPTNSVWVMPSATSDAFPKGSDDVPAPTSDTAEVPQPQNYYAVPALRCIGNTPAERKANIDLQRRQFPTN